MSSSKHKALIASLSLFQPLQVTNMWDQVLNQDPSPLQQVDIPYPSIMPCHHIPCGWLTNVVTQKFGILAINSDLFWKNGWWSLLYFCSTFKISSLACSLSLSISFCTSSICSIASCFSFSSFGSLKKQMPRLAWRQESAWPSSVSSLRVEEKTGVWGPCWGKKAKNPPRGRERNCELRELLWTFKMKTQLVWSGAGSVIRLTSCSGVNCLGRLRAQGRSGGWWD